MKTPSKGINKSGKETINQILEGCFRLLLQKNANHITMADIVASTGVSQGSIFYFFKDKEAVLRATMEYYFDKVSEYFLFFFQEEKSTLLQFIHDYVENWKNFDRMIKTVAKEDASSVFNFFFHAARTYPEFEARMERLIEQEQHCWRKVILSAIDHKEIMDVNADIMADRFQCVYMGIAIQSYFLPYSKKSNMMLVQLISLYEDIKYRNASQKSIF